MYELGKQQALIKLGLSGKWTPHLMAGVGGLSGWNSARKVGLSGPRQALWGLGSAALGYGAGKLIQRLIPDDEVTKTAMNDWWAGPKRLVDVSQFSDFADAERARGTRVETEKNSQGLRDKEVALKCGMDEAVLRRMLQETAEFGVDAYLLQRNKLKKSEKKKL